MNIQEVQKWKAFEHPDGFLRDLSFLDAHEAFYTHSELGKKDVVYKFIVTYSFHCFAKEYEHQTEEEKAALMYLAPKDKRPFCDRRYSLAKQHLRAAIEGLGGKKVVHASAGSYAVIEVDLGQGETECYFVAFRAFREMKKLRLHVTSAFPVAGKQNGHSVSFFAIARNLLANRALPHPPK